MSGLVTYIEKGHGLWDALEAAGHVVEEENGFYMTPGDVATVEAFIADYDDLPDWKAVKTAEIKAEGLAKINKVFPAINNLDEVQLSAEQWQSIAPASRQPTADFQKAIDIYTAARDAITNVNLLVDVVSVKVYDPVDDPAWPA